MNKYYVLVVYATDNAFVLNLDGYESKDRAQRAVNWQNKGQGELDRHEICTRTGPATFTNGRETFTACRGAYNDGAWRGFWDTWTEDQLPSGEAS